MNLYLDTEFDGHCGDLVSLALAGDDGSRWYGVFQDHCGEGETKRRPWLGVAATVAVFAMGGAFGMALTAEIGMWVYFGAILIIWGLCHAGLSAGRRAHRREMAEIEAIDVELYGRMDRIEAAVAVRRDDGRVLQ